MSDKFINYLTETLILAQVNGDNQLLLEVDLDTSNYT